MHVFQDKIDEVLNKCRLKNVRIEKVQLIPYREDGALLSCFTPLHICYPDGYQYNLKKLGDRLKVTCWGSPLYLHPQKHLRKDAKVESRYDCSKCTFCLEQASGYKLIVTLGNTGEMLLCESKLRTALTPFIEKVENILNAPIIDCSVNYEISITVEKPIEYVPVKIIMEGGKNKNV